MNIKQDLITDLKTNAKKAYSRAYAPYSHFNVGAALITETGQVFTGCNVENASYGLTQCAERSAICSAIAQGHIKFQTIVIYTEQSKLTPPCGACRQVIAEFFTADSMVVSCNHLGDSREWSVKELLPQAFTPMDLIEKD